MCQLCNALGYDTHLFDGYSSAAGDAFGQPGAQFLSELTAAYDDLAAAGIVGIAPSGNVYIDAVVAGYGRWTGQLTYSFPSSTAAFGAYGISVDGFQQVSATQMSAIRGMLEGTGNIYCSVESVCGLDIAELANNTARDSVNMQIAQCDNFDGFNLGTARVGDFPGSPIYPGLPHIAGDVWFGDDSGSGNDDGLQGYRTPVIGNYSWATHIHELGHALGLQHSHDVGGAAFQDVLPVDRRTTEFSAMSYLSYVGSTVGHYTNEEFGYAQTLMMYDILALQYLYGADYTTNGGNTVYTWSSTTGQMFVNGVGQGMPGANRVFLTIWDGGGTDTYDMSNYTNGVSIDLRPEMWSITSTLQLADLDSSSSSTARIARGNVFNSALFNGDTRSLIENAVGGTANDTIMGNSANNSIDGGGGTDTMIFTGIRSAYTLTDLGGGVVRVTGPDGTDTLTRVERLQFADQTVTWPPAGVADDFRDSFSDTTLPFGTVAVNGSRTGSIESNGDHDWISVQLTAGQTYVMRLQGSPSGNGTLQDTYLRLHNSGGTLLAENDDSPTNFDSVITFTATTTGTYYLNVGAYNDQYAGTYRVSVTGNSNSQPAANDFNGDGMSDILWRNDAGAIVTWNMNDGTLLAANNFGTVPAQWQVLGTDDFNGDGRTDMLWRNVSNGTVTTWDINNGTVTGSHSLGVVPANWHFLDTGDFDGDNNADILWRNDAGTVALWDLNNSTLASATNLGVVPNNWQVAGTDDFNGDGRTDILWRNTTNGTTSIWDMNGGTVQGTHNLGVVPTNWQVAGTGDFNGDSHADILWHNTTTGTLALWDMNNGNLVAGKNVTVLPTNWHVENTGDYNGDHMTDILLRNTAGTTVVWNMNDNVIIDDDALGTVPNNWHILA